MARRLSTLAVVTLGVLVAMALVVLVAPHADANPDGLERVSADKGLAKVSNQKLLKLHTALTDAQKRFGSRDKLISAILELKKRTKDAAYGTSLKKAPLPQLLDLHQSAERASKRAAAKAKAAPAKAEKKPAAKKAPAKKAAAKK